MKTGFIAAVSLLVACSVWAANTPNASAENQEFTNATQTLQDMATSNQVPKTLLNEAKCILVIPGLTKAGFLVGGEHGSGVVSCRTGNGWSAPAFFSTSGGSVETESGAKPAHISNFVRSS